jgi:hypothetical protein
MTKRYKTLSSAQSAIRRRRMDVCNNTVFDMKGSDSQGGYLVVIWLEEREDRDYVETLGFMGRHPMRREEMENRLRVASSNIVEESD